VLLNAVVGAVRRENPARSRPCALPQSDVRFK
jgi:hypothetical protein